LEVIMGLDVYLRRFEDFADTRRRESEYEAETNPPYEDSKYGQMSAAEKDELRGRCKAIAARLGLGEWGSDELRVQKIELPSACYPDHYFKIGYFRSSYNDGGINHIVENLTGKPGLYYVFDRKPDDEYHFRPDWAAAKARALALVDEIQVRIKVDGGEYRVMFKASNIFEQPGEMRKRCSSSEDAMNLFREQLRGDHKSAYYNKAGFFSFKEPLKVSALISEIGPLDQAGTYVVYDATDNTKWYLDALEIVAETCDWVLARPDVDKFYLSWSS
jgi:hypothetical protein